jgi:uncharacterized iron-regulated membrane protein
VKTAETTFDGFKVSGIHLPKTKEESINIIGAVSTQNILYGEHANSIEFDPLTGKELSRIDVTKQSAYDKWDSIVFPLHSGLFGNIIVKLIYCVAGLSPSLLSITGFLLWLRRRRR